MIPLVADLAARGIILATRDGRIVARPASALTDADRAAIKAASAEILAHLAEAASRHAATMPMSAANAQVPQVHPLSPGYEPPPHVHSCFGACATCGGQAWWLTGRGVLVCRQCAPPGSEAAHQARSVWDR